MGVRLVTADIYFDVPDQETYHEALIGPRRGARRAGWRARAVGISDPSVIGRPSAVREDVAPAVAYVNEGRWVADCPGEGCTGAVILFPAPAGFLCPACFNAEAGYQYRAVVWPADRESIESILCERPAPQTRNWTGLPRAGWRAPRGETLADLAAENATHAVRVPVEALHLVTGDGAVSEERA